MILSLCKLESKNSCSKWQRHHPAVQSSTATVLHRLLLRMTRRTLIIGGYNRSDKLLSTLLFEPLSRIKYRGVTRCVDVKIKSFHISCHRASSIRGSHDRPETSIIKAQLKCQPKFDDGSDLLDQIATHNFEENTNEFVPEEISNILCSYATAVNNSHYTLFDVMEKRILEHLKEFNPQALTDTVWAYATAGIHRPKLFERVGNHIFTYKNLDEFTPKHLSNIVWAYATAGISHPNIFEKVANHIVRPGKLTHFTDPQDVTNIVRAYATVRHPHPKLFEKLGNQIVGLEQLSGFSPQNLKDIVWAYATAGIDHPKLSPKVVRHIIAYKHLSEFNLHALSDIVWLCAKVEAGRSEMFQKVANEIIRSDKMNRCTNLQVFSNIVWSYATAGIRHATLFENVAKHIVGLDHLRLLDPQALKDVVWAYAQVQVFHPKLFHEVAKAAIHRKEEFTLQEVVSLLWAYATMGIINEQLFSSFIPVTAKLIHSCDNEGLANIAWAYAVADIDAPTLFNHYFIDVWIEKKDEIMNESDLRKLHQWHLWQTREKSRAGLPRALQDRCYKAFISSVPSPSKLQDDVIHQLSSLGLESRKEVTLDTSGYVIDAIVKVNGRTIGVEVDGPSHFIGKSKSPLARTILKRRQVPLVDGIELVFLPYWEWKRLGNDPEMKQKYLRKMLHL